MKTNKAIGWLLISGAVSLFIPYTILTIIFEYPDILRQDTATILTKFHDGGSKLILTWFAFAITGLPLLPAYILIGQKLENKTPVVRVATTIGVIGLIVQMVGLLRWTFVVPALSEAHYGFYGLLLSELNFLAAGPNIYFQIYQSPVS